MNCETCNKNTKVQQETPAQVPFFVHEAEMYRQERQLKRQQLLTGVMAALAVLPWALRVFGLL